MTLLHHVLRGTLFQELTATADVNMVAIRPHLIQFGSPAGNLIIQLQDVTGKLIATSNTVAISTLSTLSFAHKYFQFDITHPIKSGDIVRVVLTSSGYTFAEGDYIGWVNGFDLGKYSETFGALGDVDSALDVEVWQKRTIGMVRELDFADGFESSAAPTSASQVNLTNNVGATDITGLVFASASFHGAKIGYQILRTDGVDDRRESGTISLQFKPNEAAWEISREVEGDTIVGVTLTVTAAGQVQYATDDFTGQTSGFILFTVNERYIPGV